MVRTPQPALSTDNIPPLAIALEKVCWIILKARQFDVKDVSTVSDPASNASDDGMVDVLEDRPGDPVEQELTSLISALSDDEQIDLVALTWLGRDDNAIDDWPTIRTEAARGHGEHPGQTAAYLIGEPLVSDFLEEAISLFGQSCEAFEVGRL